MFKLLCIIIGYFIGCATVAIECAYKLCRYYESKEICFVNVLSLLAHVILLLVYSLMWPVYFIVKQIVLLVKLAKED